MIIFNSQDEKYKVYSFNNLHSHFEKYKEEFLNQKNYLPSKLDAPPVAAKELFEEATVLGQQLIIKLIKEHPSLELNKNHEYLKDGDLIAQIQSKFLSYNYIKDFINSIFVSESTMQAENASGNIQSITTEQLKKYIDLIILRDSYLLNPESQYTFLDLMPIFRCFENFHTHSSKYIDSSSKITLNKSSLRSNDVYINSSTIDLGIPMTFLGTGGFGRDNPGIMKAISSLFIIEGKISSVYSILLSLIEKVADNKTLDIYENYIIEKINFDKKFLGSLTSLANKLNCGNNDIDEYEQIIYQEINAEHPLKKKDSFSSKSLLKAGQILWFDNEKFYNLIPVPSVKVLSTLPILKEKTIDKYRKNLLSSYEGKHDISTKDGLKKLEEDKKGIEKKYPYVSRGVKAVATNAQNVSEFLSLKRGMIERFYAFKNITIQKSGLEKNFYVFSHTFFSKRITNDDLNSKLHRYLNNNSSITINELPNSVANRLFQSYFSEIASKISKSLKDYKLQIQKLPESSKKELEASIIKDSKNSLFQKYLIGTLTDDEKTILVGELIFKYEHINNLTIEQQQEIKYNLEKLI